MFIYNTDKLQIYFGGASDGISKAKHCIPSPYKLIDIDPFASIAQKIGVSRLSTLNQTHGVSGAVVNEVDFSFNKDGDYLITQYANVGLGVLTADCVAVILYDASNHIIAAIHAGWRGAVAEIVPKALEHMKSIGGSETQGIQIFIGPSAKPCCYIVQENFFDIVHSNLIKKVMIKKGNHWYFDTVQLIKLQMKEIGINLQQINTEFNFCTICDTRFFSHRRQGIQSGRQIAIALLK